MGDDALDPFNPLPKADEVQDLPGFIPNHLLVYYALADHPSFDPRSDRFCWCFPSIEIICRISGLGRRSVFRALEWWETNDFIFRQRRRRSTTKYTVIRRREWFKEIRRKEGRAEAIRRYEGWLAERQAEARGERAAEARKTQRKKGEGLEVSREALQEGNGNPRPSRETALKCLPGHSKKREEVLEVSPSDIQEVSLGTCIPGGTQIKNQLIGGTRTKEQDPVPTPAGLLPLQEIIAEKTKDGEDTIEERQRFIREQLAELVNTKAMPS